MYPRPSNQALAFRGLTPSLTSELSRYLGTGITGLSYLGALQGYWAQKIGEGTGSQNSVTATMRMSTQKVYSGEKADSLLIFQVILSLHKESWNWGLAHSLDRIQLQTAPLDLRVLKC